MTDPVADRVAAATAAADQLIAGHLRVAAVAASFHRSLLAAGIPERLADQLVRDWHAAGVLNTALPAGIERDEEGPAEAPLGLADA